MWDCHEVCFAKANIMRNNHCTQMPNDISLISIDHASDESKAPRTEYLLVASGCIAAGTTNTVGKSTRTKQCKSITAHHTKARNI